MNILSYDSVALDLRLKSLPLETKKKREEIEFPILPREWIIKDIERRLFVINKLIEDIINELVEF